MSMFAVMCYFLLLFHARLSKQHTPYLTDKAEHTVFYKINKNGYIKIRKMIIIYNHNVAFQDSADREADIDREINRARSKIVNPQHFSTLTFHSFTAD